MHSASPDPRCWGPPDSWSVESELDALSRIPAFGQRFFTAAFREFPTLAAVTHFIRRAEQPEDVYAILDYPRGVGIQIDPLTDLIILWDHAGQVEFGDWHGDPVPAALDHLRQLVTGGRPQPRIYHPDAAASDLIPVRPRMTVAGFLELPDDGVDRMLLDGEVWEMGESKLQGHLHGAVLARLAFWLVAWNKTRPRPRGQVISGDAGFRLIRGVDSVVRPALAYVGSDLVARTSDNMMARDGAPVLAIEILARSDTVEFQVNRVRKYLQAGTVVWEVDADFQSIRVHRPGRLIEGSNTTHELVGDPYLPGFRVAVAEFFAD